MYFGPEFAPDPKGPSPRADAGGGRMSRDPWTGRREGEKKKREQRRFVLRTFDRDVRHSSAFVPSEVEIDPRSVSVPLASTQELRIGSPC